MFRQIIIPESNSFLLNLPIDFIGKQVEVIAFTVEENQILKEHSNKDKYSWKNAKKFFDAHRISLSNFKFNRDEANER
ncbi:MAG: hypothetical protein A2033_18860 [Bacteroidetes bacterium GWA2_31_9]|nr:MAG: hypothetical protein A2033_18860 [Bacteroidetes bacterium GWA2_31_9]